MPVHFDLPTLLKSTSNTNPPPSTVNQNLISYGRGGAGNIRKKTPTPTPTPTPPTSIYTLPPSISTTTARRASTSSKSSTSTTNSTSSVEAPTNSTTTTATAATRKMSVGRGGFGNIHAKPESYAPEHAIFSFDEELRREGAVRGGCPVYEVKGQVERERYHVGRGGWGNEVHDGVGNASEGSAYGEREWDGRYC